jgi:hypothetical protein
MMSSVMGALGGVAGEGALGAFGLRAGTGLRFWGRRGGVGMGLLQDEGHGAMVAAHNVITNFGIHHTRQ